MKACVFTLGCKLNEVESASLMRALEERGFETTDEISFADVYLINTCAVTAEAEKKSRQAVARMRRFNPQAPVVVFGCAGEKDPAAFARREGVTLVSGTMRKDRIPDLLFEKGILHEEETSFCELPYPVKNKTRAYLRIQDGCNRFCSYCIIPYLRGRTRSRALSSILAEATASTAREIVLTGVDISDYRDGENGLVELIKALSPLPARFRFGSLEPSVITDEFLEALFKAGNFAEHFHLSLQSGSDRVLRAMNRHYTRQEYLDKCKKIYEVFPDAAITTDIIVGFPSETEEEFEESLSIIREAGFARVHAFPYSPREGTVAYRRQDVGAEVKKARMQRMLPAAQAAAESYLARFMGREGEALFEGDGGYTSNYLRVYATKAEEGKMYRVRLIKPYQDGAFAEILEEIS